MDLVLIKEHCLRSYIQLEVARNPVLYNYFFSSERGHKDPKPTCAGRF